MGECNDWVMLVGTRGGLPSYVALYKALLFRNELAVLSVMTAGTIESHLKLNRTLCL